METSRSARFVVDLTGIGLDEDQMKKVERSIHSAVLENLSGLRVKEDLRLRFPWEWMGIVAAFDRASLGDLDKQIQERIRF